MFTNNMVLLTMTAPAIVLRGTILNRTYGDHKNLYISRFLPTVFGPINNGPLDKCSDQDPSYAQKTITVDHSK